MQIHFTLDDEADESLIAWWFALPKGIRSETMRRMMRWYVGQDGFGALIAAVERLTAGHVALTPMPEPLPSPPNVTELLEDALSQFGFEDDV